MPPAHIATIPFRDAICLLAETPSAFPAFAVQLCLEGKLTYETWAYPVESQGYAPEDALRFSAGSTPPASASEERAIWWLTNHERPMEPAACVGLFREELKRYYRIAPSAWSRVNLVFALAATLIAVSLATGLHATSALGDIRHLDGVVAVQLLALLGAIYAVWHWSLPMPRWFVREETTAVLAAWRTLVDDLEARRVPATPNEALRLLPFGIATGESIDGLLAVILAKPGRARSTLIRALGGSEYRVTHDIHLFVERYSTRPYGRT
jgi:hypothetical protein